MDIRKLQRTIVDGLEDVKAQNIVVFNTEHLSALFERVIIASGTSNRQTKALAASVRDAVRAKGFSVMRTEGEENGEWIIVDCGAAVVHVMQPTIREYYHLEEIWGEKPVRLKLDTTPRSLVRAEEAAPQAKPSRKAAKTASASSRKLDAARLSPAHAEALQPAAKRPRKTARPATPAAVPPVAKASRKAARPSAVAAVEPVAKKVVRKRAAKSAQPAAGTAGRKVAVRGASAPRAAPTRTVGVKVGKSAAPSAAAPRSGAMTTPATRKASARKVAATKVARKA